MDEAQRRAAHAAYMREYTARNRDRINAQRRARMHSSPERLELNRKRAAEYSAANADAIRVRRMAAYHAKKKLKGYASGNRVAHYKGENVGYCGLHAWVKRYLGKPQKCSVCGTETAKRYEWANVDHKYRRVLSDFFRACTSCHRKYDYAHGLSAKGGRRKRAP